MKLRTIAIVKVMIAVVGFFASLLTGNAFAAADAVNTNMFMGNFDGESRIYTGAMADLNGGWFAVAFQNVDQENAQEDDIQFDTSADNDRIFIVDLLTDGSHLFNHNNKTFAWWSIPATDTISDFHTLSGQVNEARINGRLAQVHGAQMTNGSATVIKDGGNPLTCTFTCTGYFVQHGLIHSFVYTVVENEPTHPHKVYLPIITRYDV